MHNRLDALKLLEQLGPQHQHLQDALAALDMAYEGPKEAPKEQLEPNQKPMQQPGDVEPLSTIQALDFEFLITLVTNRQVHQNDNSQPIVDKMNKYPKLSFEREEQAKPQTLTPLWQEKPLYQALLPYFHRDKTSRQPDIAKITCSFVRRQPLKKLPMQVNKSFPAEIWLYCDHSDGASVYHRDYRYVELHLQKWFGDNCISKKFKLVQRGAQFVWQLSNNLTQGNALCPPANAIALILAPNNGWHKTVWASLESQFMATSVTRVYLPVGATLAKPSLPSAKPVTTDGQKLLACLSLSPAVITLPMVRQLRIELIEGAAELETWIAGHDNLQWYQSTNSGFWLHGLGYFQKQVGELLTKHQQWQAHQIIDEHLTNHELCWQRQHQMLTLLHCKQLTNKEKEPLEKGVGEYFGQFSKRLLDHENSKEVEWLMIQARSLGDEIANLPAAARQTLTLSNLLWRRQTGSDEQLPGIDKDLWQQWYQTAQTKPKPASVIQIENELHIVEEIVEQNNAAGAQICTLADTTSLMVQPSMAKQNQRLIPQPGSELTLTNRAESFTLETLSSNNFYWAKSLAVTSNGVVATTDYIQVSWPNTPITTSKPIIEVFDHSPLWLRLHQPQLDKYGLFIELDVKGVILKLRYVPKGSFLMGSPEDEAERLGNETQHAVTLTQGFWLGETTVTQQLWQVVMGYNPCQFKADYNQLLPVESVSWDDCQKFCERFNNLLSGFELMLPTEAQWEYACRTGTQTPFSTGQQLTATQANYHGHYPYNNGAKGEWRETTVTVDKLQLNSWGLIQMHGNVWEWCHDSMRDYNEQAEVNPVGGAGQPKRVVRGGSWINFARYCRSAFRYNYARDDAIGNIGLRVTQIEPAGGGAVAADPIRSGAKTGKGKVIGDKNESWLQMLTKKIKGKK